MKILKHLSIIILACYAQSVLALPAIYRTNLRNEAYRASTTNERKEAIIAILKADRNDMEAQRIAKNIEKDMKATRSTVKPPKPPKPTRMPETPKEEIKPVVSEEEEAEVMSAAPVAEEEEEETRSVKSASYKGGLEEEEEEEVKPETPSVKPPKPPKPPRMSATSEEEEEPKSTGKPASIKGDKETPKPTSMPETSKVTPNLVSLKGKALESARDAILDKVEAQVQDKTPMEIIAMMTPYSKRAAVLLNTIENSTDQDAANKALKELSELQIMLMFQAGQALDSIQKGIEVTAKDDVIGLLAAGFPTDYGYNTLETDPSSPNAGEVKTIKINNSLTANNASLISADLPVY